MIIAIEPETPQRQIYVLDNDEWLAEYDIGIIQDDILPRLLLAQERPYPGKYLLDILFYFHIGEEEGVAHYVVSVPKDWEVGYYQISLVDEHETVVSLYRQRIDIAELADMGEMFCYAHKALLLYCEACGQVWKQSGDTVACPSCEANEDFMRIAQVEDVVRYYREEGKVPEDVHDWMYQVMYLESGHLANHEHVSKMAAIERMAHFTDAAVTEDPETDCLSAISDAERDAYACPIYAVID